MVESLSFFSDLADELVVEILIRLPAEASIRCKAVCKRWYALISNHNYFMTRLITHHRQSQSPPPFTLVLQYDYQSNICRRNPLTDPVQIMSDHPLLRKFNQGLTFDMGFIPCLQQPVVIPSKLKPRRAKLIFELAASSADLLLCSYNHLSSSETTYYVCNLLTRQCIALPPISLCSIPFFVGFVCDPVKSSSDACYKFRVVRIPIRIYVRCGEYPKTHYSIGPPLKINAYLSEEGKWRDSVVLLPRHFEVHRISGSSIIPYNGMMHMLTLQGVVVFNPFCESRQIIPRIISLPFQSSHVVVSSISFGESKGRLRLGLISWSSQDHRNGPNGGLMFKLWELEDHEAGTWSCLVTDICIQQAPRPAITCYGHSDELCELLIFHPNDSDTVYLRVKSFVRRFNIKQNDFEQSIPLYELKHHEDKCPFYRVNAFPLVHQWWPTPVPSLP